MIRILRIIRGPRYKRLLQLDTLLVAAIVVTFFGTVFLVYCIGDATCSDWLIKTFAPPITDTAV